MMLRIGIVAFMLNSCAVDPFAGMQALPREAIAPSAELELELEEELEEAPAPAAAKLGSPSSISARIGRVDSSYYGSSLRTRLYHLEENEKQHRADAERRQRERRYHDLEREQRDKERERKYEREKYQREERRRQEKIDRFNEQLHKSLKKKDRR